MEMKKNSHRSKNSKKRVYFDHEKLTVYQRSLDFIEWLEDILNNPSKKHDAYDHLDRASTSITLNIAEGNGKFTEKDRCRYFDNSRGSALECAGCLDILVRKKAITSEKCAEGKEILIDIVSMLIGLIKSNSKYRMHEDEEEYKTRTEEDYTT